MTVRDLLVPRGLALVQREQMIKVPVFKTTLVHVRLAGDISSGVLRTMVVACRTRSTESAGVTRRDAHAVGTKGARTLLLAASLPSDPILQESGADLGSRERPVAENRFIFHDHRDLKAGGRRCRDQVLRLVVGGPVVRSPFIFAEGFDTFTKKTTGDRGVRRLALRS